MRACPCAALFLKRGGSGVTVSEAVLITPPYVAETVVEVGTAPFFPLAMLGGFRFCNPMCGRAICSPLAQWPTSECGHLTDNNILSRLRQSFL